MTDIKNRNLEQLKKYAEWEKREYPDSKDRQHILDWAVSEIERLRRELTMMGGGPTCYADDIRTPHEKAKHTAQILAVKDFELSRSCDSRRYFARPGSAWDSWYTEKYQAVLNNAAAKPHNDHQ